MNDIYKVWVHIERMNEKTDKYEDIDLPYCVFETEDLQKAEKVVNTIVELHWTPEEEA